LIDTGSQTQSHTLAPYGEQALQKCVVACTSHFATMRQLALHGLIELLLSGLMNPEQV